jgi:hypothetical protein
VHGLGRPGRAAPAVRGHAAAAQAAPRHPAPHQVLRRPGPRRHLGRDTPGGDLRCRVRRPRAAVPLAGPAVLRARPSRDPGRQGAQAAGHGGRPARRGARAGRLPRRRRGGRAGRGRARRLAADAVPVRGAAHLPRQGRGPAAACRAALAGGRPVPAGRQRGHASGGAGFRPGSRGAERGAQARRYRALADRPAGSRLAAAARRGRLAGREPARPEAGKRRRGPVAARRVAPRDDGADVRYPGRESSRTSGARTARR